MRPNPKTLWPIYKLNPQTERSSESLSTTSTTNTHTEHFHKHGQELTETDTAGVVVRILNTE